MPEKDREEFFKLFIEKEAWDRTVMKNIPEEILAWITQKREEWIKEVIDDLVKDVGYLGSIWGDGTGTDGAKVEDAKAFGLQLCVRLIGRQENKSI